jgi:hypothetical protein
MRQSRFTETEIAMPRSRVSSRENSRWLLSTLAVSRGSESPRVLRRLHHLSPATI